MWRVFQFCYQYAAVVILTVVALTVLAVWQARDVRIDVSVDTLIPKESPLREAYEESQKYFGSDTIVAVYAEDEALFTRQKLLRLESLNNRLAALDKVERIESLFTVNNIAGQDGWIDTSPLLAIIPRTAAAIHEKREQALNNPLLVRTVLSPEGDATLLTLYLDAPSITDGSFEAEVYAEIEAILADYRKDFTQLFQIGNPATQVAVSDIIISDQRILLPLSALVLVVMIGFLMRNAQGAVIPILNALISTVWTLGLMAWFGIPVNMLNYIVPALIVILGATEDVHILVEYREKRRNKTVPGMEAISGVGRTIGLTLLLTACTTILGFSATGLTDITIMQQFGITAAIGLFTRFAISLFFLPAYLRVFDSRLRPVSNEAKNNKGQMHAPVWIERLTHRMGDFIMRHLVTHPRSTIGFFILLTLPCLYFATTIRTNNDFMAFLHDDSPIVIQTEEVASHLSGPKIINVILEGETDAFKKAPRLQQVFALANWVKNQPGVDTVVSLADYLALVNREMQGGDPDQFIIPDNSPLMAQYLLFFHPAELRPYVTHDYSRTNILVRHNLNDSADINALVSEIRTMLDRGSFGYGDYTITGRSVMVAAAVDNIVRGQVLSLGTMAVLLFIIVSILFVSWKPGLLAVLSNLFPIAAIFGIMGFFNIPLNLGTCMVAAITLGIAVDDTLHLMVRYNQVLKDIKNETQAIGAALKAEILPVSITTLSLAGGFIVLGFSSFVPVVQFGLLSALVIVIALIADLILTPVLLSTTRLITLWDIIGFKLRKALMEKSQVFVGLNRWQAKKLILASDIQRFPAGTRIIQIDETGDCMYVVLEGELEVSKPVNGEKMVLTRLTTGAAIGEIALISKTKRTADVDAITDVRLLTLDWNSLEKLQRFAPYLSSRLFLNLAKILGDRLADSLGKIDTRAPFKTKAPFPTGNHGLPSTKPDGENH